MDFEEEILKLEDKEEKKKFFFHDGRYPVLLTSVHSMRQKKKDGSIKLAEPFTKSIAYYVANKTNTSYFVKTKDDGVDPNHVEEDEFKRKLLEYVKKYNIKLVLDIHGASSKRDFDVELGTLDNTSCKQEIVEQLQNSFRKYGISHISINQPFKGGNITKYLVEYSNVNVIQIEINKRYRDFNHLKKLETFCLSLSKFIEGYLEHKL